MRMYPRLERKGEALASRWAFVHRIAISLLWAAVVLAIFLIPGMFYFYESGDPYLTRTFHRAAMFLTGMGRPSGEPSDHMPRVLLAAYALASGFVLALVIGLILTPILHRVLHHFHLDGDGDTAAAPPRGAKPKPRAKRARPKTSRGVRVDGPQDRGQGAARPW